MKTRLQPPALPILRTTARNAANSGFLAEAQDITIRAMELTRKHCGTNSYEYLACLQDVVEFSELAGNHDTAEKYQYEVIAVLQNLEGKNHPSEALQLRILADILRNNGNEVCAQRMEKEAAALLAQRSTNTKVHF